MATEKTITYTRLPDETRQRVEEVAEAESRSVSNMIAVLLAEAIAARDRQTEKQAALKAAQEATP